MEKVFANYFPVLLLAYILSAIWVGSAIRLVSAIFFASVRKQLIAHPFLHGLWFFVALLITAAAFSLSSLPFPPREPRGARTMATVACLETACQRHLTEYGSLPSGDNAAITKALSRRTPTKKVPREACAREWVVIRPRPASACICVHLRLPFPNGREGI